MSLSSSGCALLALVLGCSSLKAQSPPVPPSYQDLYASLEASITAFKNTVDAGWDGTLWPVTFAGHLNTANTSNDHLFEPDFYATTVLRDIHALKAMGAKAVAVAIGFPLLYQPFFENPADYQQYLNFYIQLAADVRARGLKLIIETPIVLPDEVPAVTPFYTSLTLTEYQNARMQQVVTIAQQLRPDYLSVITEPDMEAKFTGQPLLNTANVTAMLDVILAGLQQAGVQGIAIGAGFGNWHPGYVDLTHGFASRPIQYIDIHMYPVNKDYFPRILQVADIAASYGKPVGMTEVWLSKMRDSELAVLPQPVSRARISYSFWAPLDTLFLQTLIRYSHYKRLAFMTPFWTAQFYSYLTYDPSFETLPAEDIHQMAEDVATEALLAGQISSTGQAYALAITSPPDTAPPSIPNGLTAQPNSVSSINLRWNAATDNNGVYGYKIYRNGVQVATTSGTSMEDTGLAPSTTYIYRVAAYDARGNNSLPSTAVPATTLPDTTAPSIPADLAAVPLSPTRIRLTWSASTDDVGVTGYRVYRNGNQVAQAPGTMYVDSNLTPATAYSYAVAARDAAGNLSPQTAPVTVTTPGFADTTSPLANVIAPAAGSTISGTIVMVALAADPSIPGQATSGVAGVQFQVDGVPVGSEATTAPYRKGLDTRTLSNGQHTITAIARDNAGNRGTSPPVTVTVSN